MLYTGFKNTLQDCSRLLFRFFDALIPDDGNDLSTAMRYVLLNGQAKHLRAFLVMIVADIFLVDIRRSLPLSAAIELIHAYSLVHDDLPAMDNDDMRRGLPSCHKRFNESTAILVGDALQCLAFELIANMKEKSIIKCDLIAMLAKNAGRKGLVGGQMLDLNVAHANNRPYETWLKMVEMKTAMLFATTCESGGVLAKVGPDICHDIFMYGYHFGIAFQILDDINDAKDCVSASNILSFLEDKEVTLVLQNAIDDASSHLHTLPEQSAAVLRNFMHYIMGK